MIVLLPMLAVNNIDKLGRVLVRYQIHMGHNDDCKPVGHHELKISDIQQTFGGDRELLI